MLLKKKKTEESGEEGWGGEENIIISEGKGRRKRVYDYTSVCQDGMKRKEKEEGYANS